MPSWYDRDSNTTYVEAARGGTSASGPRVTYEPPAPRHAVEWALGRGVAWAAMLLVCILAGWLYWFTASLLLLVFLMPLVVGVFIAVRTFGANHAHHLAYHAAFLAQFEPQGVDATSQLAQPPGPSARQVREAMLCRLVHRAVQEGDVTLLRSTDAPLYTHDYYVQITKEQCADCYDELRRMGILRQNPSSKEWEVVPGMTYDAAMLKIDVAYP